MEKVISNFHPYSILLYLVSMQNTSRGKLFFLISLGKVCRVRKLRNVIYEMLRAWLKKRKSTYTKMKGRRTRCEDTENRCTATVKYQSSLLQ